MSKIHSLNESQIVKLASANRDWRSQPVRLEKNKRGIRSKKKKPVVYVSRFKDPRIRSVGTKRLFHIMKQRPYTDY